jgi:hypothetical protein
MFAAGFRDHEIGTILGVADNTGAGGANVWTHELLRLLMSSPRPDGSAGTNPFRPLPSGAGMRVSIRRTIRVGAREGAPLEDLGVRPDVRHRMTRDDALHGNRDLMAAAGALLAATPVHRIELVDAEVRGDELELTIRTEAVDRADVWIDGRPAASFDALDGQLNRRVRPAAPDPVTVELRGYLDGRLVARTTRPV